jgi:hypothetical protein
MFLSALPPLIFNIKDIVVSLILAKIVITYQYLKNTQPADMFRLFGKYWNPQNDGILART